MDEKTFDCFSKGMLVLVKWAAKMYGAEVVDARVVLVEEPEERELDETRSC